MRKFRYILYVCSAIIVYGCTSAANKGAIDWDSINYAKISCNDGDKDKSCKANDEDITSMSKGKR